MIARRAIAPEPLAGLTRDGATGATQVFATSIASHERRALSDTNAAAVLPALGSTVAVGDHATFSLVNFALSTVQLALVDPAAPAAAARTVAGAANITFFVNHRRTRLIYATDDPAAPGLHVARVR